MIARLVPIIGLIVAVSLLTDAPAEARLTLTEETVHYDIRGDTAADLLDEMSDKGPEGYWGFTRWWVSWTANCEVDIEVTYTMPKWLDRDRAPTRLRQQWDRMYQALWLHEKQHGQHGINAGNEIFDTGCSEDPYDIIERWGEADRDYDARTQHGWTEGVRLRSQN
ncbi:MAG: DUF922 domain-containing protein [Pseudomonadota bacterium]